MRKRWDIAGSLKLAAPSRLDEPGERGRKWGFVGFGARVLATGGPSGTAGAS
jgi:hypothetical protein